MGIALLVSATTLTACSSDEGPDYSSAHPRIYLERNRERLGAGLAANTPAAMRFKALVERYVGGADIYGFSPWYAALMGQLTGEARYCEKAVEETDEIIKSEESLISSGQVPVAGRDSYLAVGDYVGDAMLVYDWCYSTASSGQRSRWLKYAEQAVWNVWHPDKAKWGGKTMKWNGWSIDNPSNNYYYSFLRATMLLGLGAHGESGDSDWLSFVRDEKFLGQLVPTFDRDLQGGGSREGTGYGVSMHKLWELYDLWHGSTGEDLASQSGHARASMLTFMHQIVPTLDRVAPTGDHSRDSTAAMFDYHRNYLLELAHLFRDDALAPHALYLANNSSVPEMESQFMVPYDFFYENADVTAAPLDGLGLAHYAPGIGSLYMRGSWAKNATWVNLLGGPFTESHAHQDQGSILFFKEEWLAYDPNIESSSGLEQGVDRHNLVRFKKGAQPVPQVNGTSKVLAVRRGEGWVHAAVDTKPVYKDAAVTRSEREIVFLEPDVVVVFDRYATAADTVPVWQLSSPVNPTLTGNRATFRGAKHSLIVDRVPVVDSAFSVSQWKNLGEFKAGFRFENTAAAAGAGQFLHVLSADDSVVSVTPSNDGVRFGVQLALKGGRTALVRFHPTMLDGTLELSGGGGPAVTETLRAGVTELPELR